MNDRRRVTEAVETAEGAPRPTLDGHWLLLARIAWIGVTAVVLVMYVVGAPLRITQLANASGTGSGGSLQLSPNWVATLQEIGLSADFYVAYVVALELLVAFTFLGTATLIFVRKSDNRLAILTSLMLISYGCTETTFTPGLADGLVQLLHLNPAWRFPIEAVQALGAALSLIVFYIFPDGRFTPRWTSWLAVVWSALVLLWLLFPQLPLNVVYGETFDLTSVASVIFALCWYSTGVFSLVYRYRRVTDWVQRQQMKWVVFGLVVAFAGGAARYGIAAAIRVTDVLASRGAAADVAVHMSLRPGFWLILTIVPICFCVSILRYRLWDIDLIISRTVLYAALTGALATVYTSGVVVFQQVLRALTGQESSIAIVGATLLTVLLFQPLRSRLQASIDRRFYRARVNFRQAFTDFARDVRTRISLPDLLHVLVQRTTDLLQITHAAVFLRDPVGQFQLEEQRNLPSDARTLPALDGPPLAELLSGGALSRPKDPTFSLLLPLHAWRSDQRVLVGVLALGPRLSGQPYGREEVELLLNLSGEAGAAISTAIAVAQELEAERQLAAHRASHAGRAEVLAEGLLVRPDSALTEMLRWAHRGSQDSDASAVLSALPPALRSLGAESLAGLADGYNYLLTSRAAPETLVLGLRTLIFHLEELVTGSPLRGAALRSGASRAPDHRLPAGACAGAPRALDGGPETLMLCQFWLAALVAEDLGAIAALLVRLREASAVCRAPSIGSADLAEALAALEPVAASLGAYARVAAVADRLEFLDQALGRLRECERGLPGALIDPERTIVQHIIGRWQARVAVALRWLRGQARLELRLVSRNIIAAERVTLTLDVVNAGRAAASNLCLDLVPGDSYVVADGRATIQHLRAGETVRVEFVLRPQPSGAFHPAVRVVYDDLTQSGATHTETLAVTLLTAPPYQGPIPNPYEPVTPLRPASAVFFGREDDVAFVADALPRAVGGNPLLLTGQRRMGKTSLLRQLPTRLGDGYIAVYLDGQGLAIDPGMDGFFYDIAREIADSLRLPEPLPGEFVTDPGTVFMREFLPRALAAAGERRLLLLFDEVEELEARVTSGKLDPEVFSFFRHLMQHETQLAIIFVAGHRLEELTSACWSGFFDATLHRRIGRLDEAAARALATHPVAAHLCYHDLALEKMLRVTGGHPYFLQLLCHTLVRAANRERRGFVQPDQVDAELDQVLELGEAHLKSLWDESAQLEQAVLAVLAARAVGGGRVASGDVVADLAARGVTPAYETVVETLHRLVLRDILRAGTGIGPSDVNAYGWRLELLGQWVARSPACQRVVGALRR